jgi:N-acetylmuramoyl-L-alanine amidase
VILLALLAILVPQQVLIATSRGQASVPVANDNGTAAVAAVLLAQPLGLTVSLDGSVARVTLGDRQFDFDIGSPFVRCDSATYPLVGAPYIARDTLFLPLHWLTEYVPRLFPGRYRWDPWLARLDERASAAASVAAAPPAASAPVPPPPPPPPSLPPPATPSPNPITGLRFSHTIVVDPGHGGVDPGNPGLALPRGISEKDITLSIGKLLRSELVRRGLNVVLTRSTDTLIDLASRPLFCRADCDLFVSIHVNSMPRGRRQTKINGVETYFVSDAKTEDQKRVAQMENDALRFETTPAGTGGSLGFILNDLQLNEYLRESARLAELVQGKIAPIHPGEDRGVQQGPFLVLAAALRPSILVETGFATNSRDGAFIASPQGQKKIALAIADGIVAYLLEFERKSSGAGSGGHAR